LINENTGMTFAGSVADSQMLLRYLKKELALYKIKRHRLASVNAIVTLLSHYIFSNAHSFSPYMIQFVVGGVDDTGFNLFSLDMSGSKIKTDEFTSTGSGSPVAYGVLEDNYKKDLTLEEATKLAIRAVNAAIKRDLGTGDGVDVVVINEQGAERLSAKKIKAVME